MLKIDVPDFLDKLGVNNIRVSGGEAYFSCPFDGHKRGDASPSISMNLGSTEFNCFSCGRSGNAITFLAEIEGVPPHRAWRWIREEFSPERALSLGDSVADQLLESLREDRDEPQRLPTLTEGQLESTLIDWHSAFDAWQKGDLKLPLSYPFDRGFQPATLRDWEIGYDDVSERLTIPYRDIDDQLVGFKARKIAGEGPRYSVLGGRAHGYSTFDVSLQLYGMHKISGKSRRLIVCEGELNQLALWQHGIENSVGISGHFLSEVQAGLITSAADEALLLFDEETDALHAAEFLETKIPCMIVRQHDRDPADSCEDELAAMLDGAVSSLGLRLI